MAAETPVQKDLVVSAFSEWSDKLRWDALTEKTRKAVQNTILTLEQQNNLAQLYRQLAAPVTCTRG